MTGYLGMLVSVVALAALPVLSGCGGGGGGSAAAPVAAAPEPAPGPMAEPMAEPAPEPMAEPAPEPMAEPARSGIASVADAWTLGGAGIYPVVRRATTEYLGTLDIAIQNRTKLSSISRSSVSGVGVIRVSELPDGSGIRVSQGYDRYERGHFGNLERRPAYVAFESGGGPVSEVGSEVGTEEGAVFGRVRWDDGDDDDGRWTAWGWWLHIRGADLVANAPRRAWERANVSAFAEGPEFQLPPVQRSEPGSARYRGPAGGVFASFETRAGQILTEAGRLQTGDELDRSAEGSVVTGEFTGSVDLVMTFDIFAHNIRSRLAGDIRVSRMDGVRTDLRTGASEKAVQQFGASDGPVWRFPQNPVDLLLEPNKLEEGSFLVTDNISGRPDWRGAELVSGFGEGATGNGVWSGRVSGVAAPDGSPRSIAGVFKLEATAGNTHHDFVGAFLAPWAE